MENELMFIALNICKQIYLEGLELNIKYSISDENSFPREKKKIWRDN